ncbi:hypothetical protein [Ralstonia solanacearum]|uniref:hypothetical protein n=2 Tax=Ralstonia TaxID=48736 RepID=UPI0018D00FF6|nr:hypothetical protein [Ralstonia solanacearum]
MDAAPYMTSSYQTQIAAMPSEPGSPRNAAQREANMDDSPVSLSDAGARPAQVPHAVRTSLAGTLQAFREGSRLRMSGGPTRSTQSLFRIALLASFALGGKPVCCVGVVPGVTLWIASGSTIQSRDFEEFDWDADGVWRKVQPELAGWLGMPPAPPVAQMNLGKDLHMKFAHDSRHLKSEGAMQIEVLHAPAFVSAYMKKRGAQPLMEGIPTQDETRSRHAVTMRRLLIEALEKSNETKKLEYGRLPPTIRHRATGAIRIGKCAATGGVRTSRCNRTGRMHRCASWCSSGRPLCGRIGWDDEAARAALLALQPAGFVTTGIRRPACCNRRPQAKTRRPAGCVVRGRRAEPRQRTNP